MRGTIESVAQLLADLGHVPRSQWALRLLAALVLLAAQLLAVGGAPFAGTMAAVTSLAVILCGIAQTIRPDSPAGIPALGAVAIAAISSGGASRSGLAVLAVVGICLLLVHACWALTALVPAHGRIGRRAIGRGAAGAGGALALAVGASLLVVLPLAQVRTPAAVMVLGMVALIGLVALLVPRGTPARRGR